MEKKLKFLLLCAAFLGFNSSNIAQSGSGDDTEAPYFCNAPAPQNCQITASGQNWVSLSWEPAWPGATHRIVIALKVDSIIWTPVDTLPNVPGDSITISDFAPGQYRISISTNCKEGGTGNEVAELDPPIFNLIIELVLNGRLPLNPVSVPSCEDIYYNEFNWVGFRIQKEPLGDVVNYFEFKKGTTNGFESSIIKRRYDVSNIVGARQHNQLFPKSPAPLSVILINESITIMVKKNGVYTSIGTVSVWLESSSGLVSFCENLTDPSYSFTGLTALSSQNIIGISEDRTNKERPIIKAKNISGNSISIMLHEDIIQKEPIKIEIVNILGQVITSILLPNDHSQFLIDISTIPTGNYFAHIVLNNASDSFNFTKF